MNLLKRFKRLEQEASEFGFQWETADQIIKQIHSECLEVTEHLKKDSQEDQLALQEEIGDLLHAAFSLCVFCKFDPTKTLQLSTDKFERRFNAVKDIAKETQLQNLQGQPFSKLMNIWSQAKKRVG